MNARMHPADMAHIPEALARARQVGWLDAAFDVAHKYNLGGPDARAIGYAVKATLEDEARTAFKACVARGGMRHVGNSGRV